MLLGLEIKNFKILEHLEFGLLTRELEAASKGETKDCGGSLEQLNVIVADQRSGKSTIFAALRFWREALLNSVPAALDKYSYQKATDLLSYGEAELLSLQQVFLEPVEPSLVSCYFSIDFSQGLAQAKFKTEKVYSYPLSQELVQYLNLTSDYLASIGVDLVDLPVNLAQPRLEYENTQSSAKPSIFSTEQGLRSSLQDFLFDFWQELFLLELTKLSDKKRLSAQRREQKRVARDPNYEPQLSEEGRNVDLYLAYWQAKDPHYYEELSQLILTALGRNGKRDLLKELKYFSAGEAKLAICLLLFLKKAPPKFIGVENPDQGLFPDKVDRLAASMRAYLLRQEHSQVLLTTMHMNLLENMAPQEVWTLKIRGLKAAQPKEASVNRATRFYQVAEDPLLLQMYKEGIGLGTMLYGNYFA